uniref:Synuclein, alpha interacting protein n=1 Tax=Periophthalmus magnuspinnatus TaxID=409849 RepID=A0A3B4BFS7_9GOBI
MEAPEYLDLDEIDFSDDSYSVSSLKNIPELSRRSDGAEDRAGIKSQSPASSLSVDTTVKLFIYCCKMCLLSLL